MKDPLNEIFISVDIEADGPIPIKNSMIALGAVAFTPIGFLDPLASEWVPTSFEMALQPIDSATPDSDTMTWWSKNKEAWNYIHRTLEDPPKPGLIPVEPRQAMLDFNQWVEDLASIFRTRPVFAAWPATYDHMFVYVYSMYLTGKCSISFSGFDAKTYAMALQKTAFSDTRKSKLPKDWFKDCGKHTHTPLADAKEQAQLMINMMQQNLGVK
jgi:3' exoribonuclease, RNase T-like